MECLAILKYVAPGAGAGDPGAPVFQEKIMDFTFHPIGILRSPFLEKFGIPRQARLVPEARARLELEPPYARRDAFRGLEAFSHVWLVFVFHEALREAWHATVRPPRLGGNRRVGVFASRSPFRPNPVGISAVALDGVVDSGDGLVLELSGVDLLDGTPVLDVKPYVPYADHVPRARGGFAAEAPEANLPVEFAPGARRVLKDQEAAGRPGLVKLVRRLLRLDPRPAYRTGRGKTGASRKRYGMRLYDLDVRWEVKDGRVRVVVVEK